MKVQVVPIIILILNISTFLPTTGSSHVADVTTLFVGGEGSGNYTTIQSAIDNASDGDTVFVCSYSSPYCENVIIDKKIKLIGEDRDCTIINGKGKGNTLHIVSEDVTVSGFTITNGSLKNESLGNKIGENNWFYAGIRLTASNSTICGNNICRNTLGIFGKRVTNITIFDNIFIGDGITFSLYDNETEPVHFNIKYFIHDIHNNTINGNTLFYYKNQQDIIVPEDAGQIIAVNCKDITIYNVTLVNADYGCILVNCSNCSIEHSNILLGDGMLWLIHSGNNKIQCNHISNNFEGICLDCGSTKNIVQHNDIIDNDKCGIIIEDGSNYNRIYKNNLISKYRYPAGFNSCYGNRWRQNYWNEYRAMPKLIFGKTTFNECKIPWINVDWCPAKKPYRIPDY